MTISLLEAFEEHLNTRPDKVFCVFLREGTPQTITFRDLAKRASAYANLYRKKGLNPGEIVLIVLQHCPDLYYAFLGALLCGCVPSFMPFPSGKQDPVRYWESHRQLFRRIGSGAILTFPSNAELLAAHISDAQFRLILTDESAGEPEEFPFHRPGLDDVAFLQHSSGTTGLKKGVQLSYGAVAAQIKSYAATLQLISTDRIATWLPLYHDMGLIACFVLPLTLGLTTVSMDAFEWVSRPEMLLDAIADYGCTHVWLPNFAFHHLCRTAASECRSDLSAVKAFIDCSEPCKPETFELFAETFAHAGVRREQLQSCYAMAEAVFAVTQTQVHCAPTVLNVDKRLLADEGRAVQPRDGVPVTCLLSVGSPVPGMEVRIVDQLGGLVRDGLVGQVAIRSAFLFSGYFRNDEATRAGFRGDWYLTGDTGLLLGNQLYILGRLKELIIVYGKNLYCHDIEFICNRVEGVKNGRCVAVANYDESIGSEELVIIAETQEQNRDQWREIRKAIKAALVAEIGISPKDIRIVEPGWLIKSTSGKIARGENRTKYMAELRGEAMTGAEVR